MSPIIKINKQKQIKAINAVSALNFLNQVQQQLNYTVVMSSIKIASTNGSEINPIHVVPPAAENSQDQPLKNTEMDPVAVRNYLCDTQLNTCVLDKIV